MTFKDHFTVKNLVFLILIIIGLKTLSEITVIALLFFAAYVISCSLNPLVDKLEQKKINRSTAATLVMFGTLTIFISFFVPIIFVAVKQVQGLINILPDKLKLIQDFILHYQFHGHRIPEIINIDSIIKSSSPFATGLVNQSINFTLNFAQGILFFLAICMIVFYFMADKTTIKNGIMRIFPNEMKEKASDIYDNISHKVGGYVIAQLLNMFVVGLLTALAMSILKINYAVLLGLITGILDIIPIIGPTIALILCLLMANQFNLIFITLVIALFITAQWIASNFIRPVIFGKFLDLHPLIIIFALFVSAQFLGVWGVILAPAIASLVCVLFDEIYLKILNKSDEHIL